MPLMPVTILAMFGQKEWRLHDLWSCDNLWPVECIQANKISHEGLWCNDRFSKVPAGIAKGAEIRVQGSGMRVTLRSYGQRSFIMCSHWSVCCHDRGHVFLFLNSFPIICCTPPIPHPYTTLLSPLSSVPDGCTLLNLKAVCEFIVVHCLPGSVIYDSCCVTNFTQLWLCTTHAVPLCTI